MVLWSTLWGKCVSEKHTLKTSSCPRISVVVFVDPLVQMGANIIVCDPHRVIVTGKTTLGGQTLRSPDIRAGMALMIAALCSTKRPCIIQNAEVVDRGYVNIVQNLQKLGADIERVPD